MGPGLAAVSTLMERLLQPKERTDTRLSPEELEKIQGLIEREDARIIARRQGLPNRGGNRCKTIPLAQVLGPLERSKETYKGDAKYVAAVERTIAELKRRYDGQIPVD